MVTTLLQPRALRRIIFSRVQTVVVYASIIFKQQWVCLIHYCIRGECAFIPCTTIIQSWIVCSCSEVFILWFSFKKKERFLCYFYVKCIHNFNDNVSVNIPNFFMYLSGSFKLPKINFYCLFDHKMWFCMSGYNNVIHTCIFYICICDSSCVWLFNIFKKINKLDEDILSYWFTSLN